MRFQRYRRYDDSHDIELYLGTCCPTDGQPYSQYKFLGGRERRVDQTMSLMTSFRIPGESGGGLGRHTRKLCRRSRADDFGYGVRSRASKVNKVVWHHTRNIPSLQSYGALLSVGGDMGDKISLHKPSKPSTKNCAVAGLDR